MVKDILFALSRSGLNLREFNLLSPDNRLLGQTARDSGLCFPGLQMYFELMELMEPGILASMNRALGRVTKMHIDMCDEALICMPGLRVSNFYDLRGGDLARFFAQLPQLEDVRLRIYSSHLDDFDMETYIVPMEKIFGSTHFEFLRKLALSSLWLEPHELCDLLSKHESSLETLELLDINLGGTKEATQAVPVFAPDFGPTRTRPCLAALAG